MYLKRSKAETTIFTFKNETKDAFGIYEKVAIL